MGRQAQFAVLQHSNIFFSQQGWQKNPREKQQLLFNHHRENKKQRAIRGGENDSGIGKEE
jgi:hypothetical protein